MLQEMFNLSKRKLASTCHQKCFSTEPRCWHRDPCPYDPFETEQPKCLVLMMMYSWHVQGRFFISRVNIFFQIISQYEILLVQKEVLALTSTVRKKPHTEFGCTGQHIIILKCFRKTKDGWWIFLNLTLYACNTVQYDTSIATRQITVYFPILNY